MTYVWFHIFNMEPAGCYIADLNILRTQTLINTMPDSLIHTYQELYKAASKLI